MKLRRFATLPILSVFSLTGFVYYVIIFKIIQEWLGLWSSSGLLNALIFTFSAALCLFSFISCVLTDPGGVPPGYVPDVEENQVPDQEFKKSGVHPRRCDKCSAFKPTRAHHCRVCRRCILRMDHHCVWINNCVGHRNYKSFVTLVFYSTLASTYSAVIVISCALHKDMDSSGGYSLKNFCVACGVVTVGLSVILGSLLVWHIYLITHNLTTIEYHEGKRSAWLARKSGLTYRHPFDVGAYKNITLILGPSMLKWMWPTATSHIRDGLSFRAARDNDSS
ncbi:putative protein S-acyltransferase 15 [Primulina tabacum]|uniref:putative protein S-acyltransferase 15 n=1 Tax=Primulina tabacum TaxID=48773 RepID=UPI003F59EE7F